MTTARKSSTRELVLCGIFTALIAVGAFIRIPVPLVPFTMQVFFVIMAGLMLGARQAAVSTGVYVFLGLVGVPIFTQGGGPSYIFQPTFGYLIGFIFAAYAVGKIAYARGKNPSWGRMMAAAMVGLGISYFFGVVYCYGITNWVLGIDNSAWQVFLSGCLLVAPGNIVCAFLAVAIVKRLAPQLQYLYH